MRVRARSNVEGRNVCRANRESCGDLHVSQADDESSYSSRSKSLCPRVVADRNNGFERRATTFLAEIEGATELPEALVSHRAGCLWVEQQQPRQSGDGPDANRERIFGFAREPTQKDKRKSKIPAVTLRASTSLVSKHSDVGKQEERILKTRKRKSERRIERSD